MKKFWLVGILAVICLLSLPPLLYAEEDIEFLFIHKVPSVMLASKTMEKVNEAPAIISVITAAELKKMGARTYLDALKQVPGVEISLARYGQYEIAVRGIKTSGTEKVLVLIDGHSVNESFFGSAMTLYDDLSIDNIKQIEVIRGPGSALYGANAFVGVINIVTKKAKDIAKQSFITQVGSWHTKKVGLLFGKEFPAGDVAGYVEYFDTDGFKEEVTSDLQTILDGLGGSSASLAPGKTYFPKEKLDFNLNASYGDISLSSKFLKRKRGDYIGLVYSLGDETEMDLKQGFLEVKYNKEITTECSLEYRIFYDYFHEDIYFQVFPRGYTNSLGEVFSEGYIIGPAVTNQKYGTELQLNFKVHENHDSMVGLFYEYLNQNDVTFKSNANPFTDAYLGGYIDVTEPWNWNKNVIRKIWAVYLQDRWSITEKLNVTLGVRHDDYSDFGGTTNPRVGIVWKNSEALSFKILFGKAFRAPNFRELYDRNNTSTVGNPELDPEKITTYELGVSYDKEKVRASAACFSNEIKNTIVEGAKPSPTDPSPFVNLSGTTKVRGLELEGRYLLSQDNYLYANYSYQHTKDASGNSLHDVPQHKGNLGGNFRMGEYLNSNTNLFISGKRPRAPGDGREAIGSYVLVNTTLIANNFSDSWELSFSVYNLLDRNYDEPGPTLIPDDYPQAGRSYWLKAAYSF